MILLDGPFDTWDLERPTGVAVGVFDGIHRGHRHVLDILRTEADRRDLASAVLTFDPHPLRLLAPDRAPRYLTSIEERIDLLESAGVDVVAVLGFTRSVRDMQPEEFVDAILVSRLQAGLVVAGEDFRFGYRRGGDVELLGRIGPASGFEMLVTPLLGEDSPFSSTRIRAALQDGDVSGGADLLGRPHGVTGIPVGIHNVNGIIVTELDVDSTRALPAEGSYVGRAPQGIVALTVHGDIITVESRAPLQATRVEFLAQLAGAEGTPLQRLEAAEVSNPL